MRTCSGGPGDERGFVTVQTMLATGFLLMLLVVLSNVLVDLYARAAVRGALDEGARAGARGDGGVAACERAAHDALSSVLRGPIGRNVHVSCSEREPWVVSSAAVRLPSWVPALVPDWRFELRAAALRERG